MAWYNGIISIASTAVTGSGYWKWGAIGIGLLAVVSGSVFTVHSYNSALTNAQETKQLLDASQKSLIREHANFLAAQQQAADLKTFYSSREKRFQAAIIERDEILAGRDTRDENGNIADTVLLTHLNELFQNLSTSTAGNSKGAAVTPRVPGAGVAGKLPGVR